METELTSFYAQLGRDDTGHVKLVGKKAASVFGTAWKNIGQEGNGGQSH